MDWTDEQLRDMRELYDLAQSEEEYLQQEQENE